ncbi:unnamed protein product [Symbiodinium sp. CCMP2456]|nr:unnamed protein product [Symbiodinium sp. CCMP2456]
MAYSVSRQAEPLLLLHMAISDFSASRVRRSQGLKRKRHSSTSDMGECPVRLQSFGDRLTWSRDLTLAVPPASAFGALVSDGWRGHTTGSSQFHALCGSPNHRVRTMRRDCRSNRVPKIKAEVLIGIWLLR